MNLAELCTTGPVITDGAWGTELQNLGLPRGHAPDLWNLSHPDSVADVAQAYVDAGSRVILTNTFRANRLAVQGDIRAINRAGVEISRSAARGRAHVFASIGPAGTPLAAGQITPGAASRAFAEQAAALAESGADALVLETFTDLEEASLALAAARLTGLPVIVSFSFDATGVAPEPAARRMADEGAASIGANCGSGIGESLAICRSLRAATSLPLWIKPNAGLPQMHDGRPVYTITPQQFAQQVPALIEAGADFVGGCCGTTPDFVSAIRRLTHAI
jgi:methionine synthase I (cobalamin-dependent)